LIWSNQTADVNEAKEGVQNIINFGLCRYPIILSGESFRFLLLLIVFVVICFVEKRLTQWQWHSDTASGSSEGQPLACMRYVSCVQYWCCSPNNTHKSCRSAARRISNVIAANATGIVCFVPTAGLLARTDTLRSCNVVHGLRMKPIERLELVVRHTSANSIRNRNSLWCDTVTVFLLRL